MISDAIGLAKGFVCAWNNGIWEAKFGVLATLQTKKSFFAPQQSNYGQ